MKKMLLAGAIVLSVTSVLTSQAFAIPFGHGGGNDGGGYGDGGNDGGGYGDGGNDGRGYGDGGNDGRGHGDGGNDGRGYGDGGNDHPSAQVPEPSTIMLVGSGLLGLWAIRRKRS